MTASKGFYYFFFARGCPHVCIQRLEQRLETYNTDSPHSSCF